MQLFPKLFAVTRDSIQKLVEKQDADGLVRALKSLKNTENRHLVFMIMDGLESINNSRAWNEAIKVLGESHLPYLQYMALRRWKDGEMSNSDDLNNRKRAIRLIGKMGKPACEILKSAFDYAADNHQNEKITREEDYTYEVNGAIIISGKCMIPFLQQKLSDQSPIRYRSQLVQADRAAILIKEIDRSAVNDPKVLQGLINVARVGIPIRQGYQYDSSAFELGQLCACEGLVWLGKPELAIDKAEELALRVMDSPKSPIDVYEKALTILGLIHNPQAISALEKAFETEFRGNRGDDYTGHKQRYIIATDRAIIQCGELIVPFLKSKLSDGRMIRYGTEESYRKNQIYATKQSDRARSLLKELGVAS